MASAIVALGIMIYFSGKKISEHRGKRCALKDETFVPHNIADNMTVSGDSFILLGHHDDPQCTPEIFFLRETLDTNVPGHFIIARSVMLLLRLCVHDDRSRANKRNGCTFICYLRSERPRKKFFLEVRRVCITCYIAEISNIC
jgi:hypothetical protein